MFSVCCVVVAGGHVCDLFLFVFRLFASLFLLSLGSVRVCVCAQFAFGALGWVPVTILFWMNHYVVVCVYTLKQADNTVG